MLVLGIESSCDETAVAILRDRDILSAHVASQEAVHAPFGGVVPELASRQHIEALPTLIDRSLSEAQTTWKDLDGIAVTYAPGLIGCVLVGLSYAKGAALANNVPLIGVNHLAAHMHVASLSFEDLEYPYIGLVVSGGHTSLYLVHDLGDYTLLGATRDDAAGEAYDKVAKLMDLGYPGGPIVDRLAHEGTAGAVKFPKAQLKKRGSPFEIGDYDFSFSGLKTAVSHYVQKHPDTPAADIAAGFQSRVIDELCSRLMRATEEYNCPRVVVAGGVAANKGLRTRLQELEASGTMQVFIPPFAHCTDNAIMIAWTGMEQLRRGERSDWNLNAAASAELGLTNHKQ